MTLAKPVVGGSWQSACSLRPSTSTASEIVALVAAVIVMIVSTVALARGEAADDGGGSADGGRRPPVATLAARRNASFIDVLGAIAIVPSAPVLVPELAGAAAAEVADLRGGGDRRGRRTAAALDCRRRRATRTPCSARTASAPSPVTASTWRCGCRRRPTAAPTALPLCALFAGWVRGRAQPEASAEVRVYADDHDAEAAVAIGRQLRAEIDAVAEPVGVLVVADGANTLTPAAPGGYRPRRRRRAAALDDALASGDLAALTRLPAQVVGRVAFQVLAGLTEPAPRSAKELYRAAPYGVGYFAGVWQP